MPKRTILIVGPTERLRRRLAALVNALTGLIAAKRADCVDIETYFAEHRIEAVLIECYPGFQQDIVNIHRSRPALPLIAYKDEPNHADTRSAFLCGVLDVLEIRSTSSDDLRMVLERALDPLGYSNISDLYYPSQSIRTILQRGATLQRQLQDGRPPQFYMNGNRAVLLRANVLCTQPVNFWQQDAAWEWIQEFGMTNSFLFDSPGSILRLGTIVEQDFVNAASFKRMLSARLDRLYERMEKFHCICAATSCSSDYLSLSVLHHLDNRVELVFYLDSSQTIPDSSNRRNASLPDQLYSEFCSAVATRDVDSAVGCIDRAVEKLCSDMPPPNLARNKLTRFLWEFISIFGSRNEPFASMDIDESRICTIRDSIVNILRTTMASADSAPSSSPLSELISRIEANPGLPINIDQAAEETNFSRSHFCRLFRQQTGLSFNAFLTQKRIAMACDLLKKTGMRIDEISDSIGIGNTWYFKKLFQKETGLTVENWMEQNCATTRKN